MMTEDGRSGPRVPEVEALFSSRSVCRPKVGLLLNYYRTGTNRTDRKRGWTLEPEGAKKCRGLSVGKRGGRYNRCRDELDE